MKLDLQLSGLRVSYIAIFNATLNIKQPGLHNLIKLMLFRIYCTHKRKHIRNNYLRSTISISNDIRQTVPELIQPFYIEIKIRAIHFWAISSCELFLKPLCCIHSVKSWHGRLLFNHYKVVFLHTANTV